MEEAIIETGVMNTMERDTSSLPQGDELECSEAKEQRPDPPERSCNEERICSKNDLLFHRNVFLEQRLSSLRTAYHLARKNFSEEKKALLKVRVDRANQEIVDMRSCTGRETDVRKTFLLLEQMEE